MKPLSSIGNCMKRTVFYIGPDTTISEAVTMMVDKRVGTLPVVDENDVLVGVTTISDIIKIFLPDFVSLLSDIDFIKDYGNFKMPSPETLEKVQNQPISEIMEKPVAVEGDSSLIRALSIMHKHNLADLPVLKQGKLCGIASRVDIGGEFFSSWRTSKPERQERD
jgi:CBS domain-containing protein